MAAPATRIPNLAICVMAMMALGLAGVMLPAEALGDGGMRGPHLGSTPRRPLESVAPDFRKSTAVHDGRMGTGFFLGLLRFYRTVVSPVDGDRCSMAPTCSLYSRQALRDHGVIMGILLTADRLLHEADEIPLAHKIVIGGETYYYDPIANNTYWLR